MLNLALALSIFISGSVAFAAEPMKDDKNDVIGTIAPADEKEAEKFQKLLKMRDQSGDVHFDEKYLLSVYFGSSAVVADPDDGSFGAQTSASTFQANLTYQMSNDLSMAGFIGLVNYDDDAFFGGDNATLVPLGFQSSFHMGNYFYVGGTAGFAFFDANDDSEVKIFLGPHLGFKTRTEHGLSIGFEAQALITPDSPDTYTQGNLLVTLGWWL